MSRSVGVVLAIFMWVLDLYKHTHTPPLLGAATFQTFFGTEN